VRQIPVFDVDEALPLAISFEPITRSINVSDIKERARTFIKMQLGDLSDVTAAWVLWVLQGLLGFLVPFFSYANDYRQMAAIIGVPLGELVLVNLAYEFTTACTSVIAPSSALLDEQQRPLHIRTLDWPLDGLGEHTAHFLIRRSGRLQYHSITWPGMIGCFTVVKPGCFSVSLNARYTVDSDEELDAYFYMQRMGAFFWMATWHRAWIVGHLIRHVADTCNSYDDAVRLLSSAPLLTPAYFAVCGVNAGQGCIISRNDASQSNGIGCPSRNINNHDSDAIPYVIQTNIDIPAAYTSPDSDKVTRLHGAFSDTESVWRYVAASETLQTHASELDAQAAAALCCKSSRHREGVRRADTAFMCILAPWCLESPIASVRPTRVIGYRSLPTTKALTRDIIQQHLPTK
jgi:hypothetical protein